MKRRSASPILPQLLLAALALLVSVGAESQQPAKPAPFTVQVTGTGRPMILIPRLNSGGYVWDGTVAHFKNRYQCHVLTLAGFAGQPALADGEPFLEQVRDNLIRYIREHKLQRPVLVGHSLGAFNRSPRIPHHKVTFPPTAKHFIQLDDPAFLFREMETFLRESEAAAKSSHP